MQSNRHPVKSDVMGGYAQMWLPYFSAIPKFQQRTKTISVNRLHSNNLTQLHHGMELNKCSKIAVAQF